MEIDAPVSRPAAHYQQHQQRTSATNSSSQHLHHQQQEQPPHPQPFLRARRHRYQQEPPQQPHTAQHHYHHTPPSRPLSQPQIQPQPRQQLSPPHHDHHPHPPGDHDLPPSVRRRPRAAGSHQFLRAREMGASAGIPSSLVSWIEGTTLTRLDGGRYVDLDRASPLVRSTISIAFSHDGRFFASTHGDHSVKVFEYPTGRQIACLDGHPRTPWTVRFHPHDSSILASGCLGGECIVWDVAKREWVRKHHFRSSISCVSFSPDGDLLAVTSGRSLLLWDYTSEPPNGARATSSEINGTNGPGLPRELIEGQNPFHMVDFHPSGTMLMTGEKNRGPSVPSDEQQFTLKLVIHRFDRRFDKKFAEPVLTVPRAVAYNDAGIHFSPCGTMLAACVPVQVGETFPFHIAVLSLVAKGDVGVGAVLFQTPLDRGHVTALTNLKFSPTSKHLLAGFSFRPNNPVLRRHAERYEEATAAAGRSSSSELHQHLCEPPQVRVVDIYKVDEKFERIRSLCADMDVGEGQGGAEDEINVAVFSPVRGVADGVVYGTQKGRIRMFQQATGTAADMYSSCGVRTEELAALNAAAAAVSSSSPSTSALNMNHVNGNNSGSNSSPVSGGMEDVVIERARARLARLSEQERRTGPVADADSRMDRLELMPALPALPPLPPARGTAASARPSPLIRRTGPGARSRREMPARFYSM